MKACDAEINSGSALWIRLYFCKCCTTNESAKNDVSLQRDTQHEEEHSGPRPIKYDQQMIEPKDSEGVDTESPHGSSRVIV